MEQQWPKLFGITPIRPLAIGTYGDIVNAIAELGLALDAKADIRRYLGIYCSRASYLESLIGGAPRYTINGEIRGSVSEEDMAAARLKIAILKKCKKAAP